MRIALMPSCDFDFNFHVGGKHVLYRSRREPNVHARYWRQEGYRVKQGELNPRWREFSVESLGHCQSIGNWLASRADCVRGGCGGLTLFRQAWHSEHSAPANCYRVPIGVVNRRVDITCLFFTGRLKTQIERHWAECVIHRICIFED